MPDLARSALTLLVLALSCAGCDSTESSRRPDNERHAPARRPADVRKEIRAANRSLQLRFEAGDMIGVADAYADDAILIEPDGERIVGREEIDAFWSRTTDPVEWKLDVDRIRGGSDLAVENGTSTLVATRDGRPSVVVTGFSFVWRRDPDGTWRILVATTWLQD